MDLLSSKTGEKLKKETKKNHSFKISGNGPKGIQQIKKHLLKEIY